jgi:predicted TIM-barrel fold metal-dependent hydrolase
MKHCEEDEKIMTKKNKQVDSSTDKGKGLSRRSFLTASALGAGSIPFVSSSVTQKAFAETTGKNEDIKELKLKDWNPQSMLKVKETHLDKALYPVVDAHNHLGDGRHAARFIKEMDAAGVQTVVNLDGGRSPERVARALKNLDEAYPGRFLTYALIDFKDFDDPGWSKRASEKLEKSFKLGAKGLKIHKSLGLGHRHSDGSLIKVDDPKIDACWQMCAKYKRPVVIHTSDPAAFFNPLDKNSERWHELNKHPGWLFYGKDRLGRPWPSRMELLEARNRMIARNSDTIFNCAHMANMSEDLGLLGSWLDAYPNLMLDVDARINELGRQPYTTRRFIIKYQDRMMFGTDTPPFTRDIYSMYYRFLETDDEYFDCAKGHHRQGFWMIYGIHLPDKVLRKMYCKNPLKYLYGLEESEKILKRPKKRERA